MYIYVVTRLFKDRRELLRAFASHKRAKNYVDHHPDNELDHIHYIIDAIPYTPIKKPQEISIHDVI